MSIYLLLAAVLVVYMFVWGLIALNKNRADLADQAWGPGFSLIAWILFIYLPFNWISLLFCFMISLWSLRLFIHIHLKHRLKPEDFRYQKMRKEGGSSNARFIFKIFGTQTLILLVVSSPLIWVIAFGHNLNHKVLWITIPYWIFGFLIETISDWQLLKFEKKKRDASTLLTSGIWKYSRHPNYAGELIQWWAIGATAAFIGYGWVTLIGPLLLTFLMLFISGIAPVEKKQAHLRDFIDYRQKTPVLLPPQFFNGTLYFLSWIFFVTLGPHLTVWINCAVFVLFFSLQIVLFVTQDQTSLLQFIPLVSYATLFGALQEFFFISSGQISYLNSPNHLPVWILFLYPLFAQTLNSAYYFLNRHLLLPLILGGLGSAISYLSAVSLGSAMLKSAQSLAILSLSWSLFLTLLIFLNRKLANLRDRYTDQNALKQPITIFFDPSCPVCAREMNFLKKREQKGKIIYAAPTSQKELSQYTGQFDFKEMMQVLHAVDFERKIIKGIDVIAQMYAKTNLPLISILIEAPLFRSMFTVLYLFWAKIRSTKLIRK